MNKPLFFLFLLSSLALTSCHSSRRLAGQAPDREQLSRQLGFPVNRHDDLKLLKEASRWLGVPYRYGGTSVKGVDCSGLVGQIYQNVYHTALARTVTGIAEQNCRKVAKGNLQAGDLLFFNTSKKKKGINHVGLFLKEGYFIHATTSKGVMINHLSENYYRNSWKQGGRVR